MMGMEKAPHIRLRTHAGEDGVAYLELAAYPALKAQLEHPGDPHELEAVSIARSIQIHGLIEGYNGPALCLELDKDGRAIGIEILYPLGDCESEES
jgi:hypothetical protein